MDNANEKEKKRLNVVLLDDNFILRQAIKILVYKIGLTTDLSVDIYTSENGIEGLGYIMLTKPNIVIIDTTLPEYSGRELIDYLTTNPAFLDSQREIIVLSQKGTNLGLPENFHIVDKTSKYFLVSLSGVIKSVLTGKAMPEGGDCCGKFLKFLLSKLVTWANRTDLIMYYRCSNSNIFISFFGYVFWFVSQIVTSFYFVLLRSLLGVVQKDQNLSQYNKDLSTFRVRYYPTIITIIITLLITIIQVILFITGGIVILNTKIDSIFASSQDNTTINFLSSDEESISFFTENISFDGEGVVLNNKESVFHGQVHGLTREAESDLRETNIGYLDTFFIIDRRDPIMLLEESTINTKSTSQSPFYASGGFDKITYQISKDNINWYHYNNQDNNKVWEITNLGCDSSNTIQEINSGLSDLFSGQKLQKLYVRVCLISEESNSDLKLFSLSLVSSQKRPVTNADVKDLYTNRKNLTIDDLGVSFNSLIYKDGKLRVKGELSPIQADQLAEVSINDEILSKYEIQLYYEDQVKEDSRFIASARLLSEKGTISFVIEQKFNKYIDGNFFAKLVSKDDTSKILAVSAPEKLNTIYTNTTDDASDLKIDGDCMTLWQTCSLRAAIQEANELKNPAIIKFRIPVFVDKKIEKGFRDKDRMNQLSSADLMHGDDFWVIKLNSSLPIMTNRIAIDGDSQTLVIDSNSKGAEIFIDAGSIENFSSSVFTGKLGSVKGVYFVFD